MTPQILSMAMLLGQTPDDPTAFLNQHFAKHWQENKITPAERCTDHEFVRRASLDLIGRIPTVPEIDAFLKDAPKERRRLLVERLLKHEDGPRHFANLWTDWLLGASVDGAAREAFHGWLQPHFAKNTPPKDWAAKLITATGTTRDNPAVHFFVAHRGQMFPKKDWEKWGQYEMFTVTNHLVRAFLGQRLQCVQCHDHPFLGDLGQHHFHGMNVFFRQVEFKRKQVGNEIIEEVRDNPAFNKSGLANFERRNSVLMMTDPTFLNGKRIPKGYKGTRREAVAEFLTMSPWFAKAYVHRMWGHFFGRGLGETSEVDDFYDNGTVTIVHPKVLDRLTQAFLASGQDSQALMRWICLSEVYGLSSVANKSNYAPDQDVAFARQQLRRLTNAQLVESLLTAVRVEAGERAKLRRAWHKDLYIAPHTVWAECEFEPRYSLGDLPSFRMVWLMNNSPLEDAIQRAVADADTKLSVSTLQALFLRTLSRPATPREIDALTKAPTVRMPPAFKTEREAETFWRGYYGDVFWSLLNSGEFALNH